MDQPTLVIIKPFYPGLKQPTNVRTKFKFMDKFNYNSVDILQKGGVETIIMKGIQLNNKCFQCTDNNKGKQINIWL